MKPASWARVGLLLGAMLACDAENTPLEHPFPPEPELEPTVSLDLDLSGTPEEAGSRIYAQLECAGCHESAAVPGLIVTPLQTLSSRYDEDTLTAFLAAPPPPMPRFELSEPERQALATYLLSHFD